MKYILLGEEMMIYDVSCCYFDEGMFMIVITNKKYNSDSSRD